LCRTRSYHAKDGTHRQQRRQRGLARPRRPRDENVRPGPPPSIPSSAAAGGDIVAVAFRAHCVVVLGIMVALWVNGGVCFWRMDGFRDGGVGNEEFSLCSECWLLWASLFCCHCTLRVMVQVIKTSSRLRFVVAVTFGSSPRFFRDPIKVNV
jgi:hypothetical protein